jgi:hypothetical protein
VQTDGEAKIGQHSHRCTGDGDVDATTKRTHTGGGAVAQ